MQPLALLEKTVQQDHLIARRNGDAEVGKHGFAFLAQRLDIFWPAGKLSQSAVESLTHVSVVSLAVVSYRPLICAVGWTHIRCGVYKCELQQQHLSDNLGVCPFLALDCTFVQPTEDLDLCGSSMIGSCSLLTQKKDENSNTYRLLGMSGIGLTPTFNIATENLILVLRRTRSEMLEQDAARGVHIPLGAQSRQPANETPNVPGSFTVSESQHYRQKTRYRLRQSGTMNCTRVVTIIPKI